MASIYLIGSLRNPEVTRVAAELRKNHFEVFDCWMAAGPEADDYWQRYATERGQTYRQALADYPAQHVLAYDRHHLERCDCAVLLMPAGKSGHIELGYAIGRGKPGFILMPEAPDRFDVMYGFADAVCMGVDELIGALYVRFPPF